MNKEIDKEITLNKKQNKTSEDTEFDKKIKQQVDSVKKMFDAFSKSKEESEEER